MHEVGGVNYYPRYSAHYVAKTLHLTMEQDGAFNRLLDWVYMNERAVPHTSRYVIARATTASERKAVDAVLAEFFERDGDTWRNARADAEIAEAAPRIAAAKANGRAGGRPRKNPPAPPAAGPQDNPPGGPDGNPPGSNEKPTGLPDGKPSGKAPHSPFPNLPTGESSPTPAEPASPAGAVSDDEPPPAAVEFPNPAAGHAIALNRAGFRCTSYTPDLVAAVAEGVSVGQLVELTAMPDFAGKPAAYLIRAARRMHAERAQPVPVGTVRHEPARKLSAAEQVRAAIASRQHADAELVCLEGEVRRVG